MKNLFFASAISVIIFDKKHSPHVFGAKSSCVAIAIKKNLHALREKKKEGGDHHRSGNFVSCRYVVPFS